MENKYWSFKVPGDPDGREKVINTSEIRSVYALLDMLHSEELQAPETEPAAKLQAKPKGALLPFVSRMMDKRRHPSA